MRKIVQTVYRYIFRSCLRITTHMCLYSFSSSSIRPGQRILRAYDVRRRALL